jgi:hypothetical protein
MRPPLGQAQKQEFWIERRPIRWQPLCYPVVAPVGSFPVCGLRISSQVQSIQVFGKW